MVRNPDVQKKAQEELDAVVGHGRLPGLDDRSRLPYMGALLLEVLRYHPVGPMGRYFLTCIFSLPVILNNTLVDFP